MKLATTAILLLTASLACSAAVIQTDPKKPTQCIPTPGAPCCPDDPNGCGINAVDQSPDTFFSFPALLVAR
jgi:hypothetical protein